MIAFLAFALPLTLFISGPSTLWNFDGVACAAALELGQPANFFHANHLLYAFLGYGFWKFVALPAGISRALPALQLFTSLLSAFGLVGLYRLLEPVLKDKAAALALTLGLATTSAFWVWSVEAQVYTLGFLALVWATVVLIHYRGPAKYVYVGLLHGAAILGHLMHFLWILPALYWLRQESKSPRRSAAHYLATLGATVAIPYLLILALVIFPGRDMPHILIWLRGSASLTADRSWGWHSMGWKGPWIWLTSTLPALWGTFQPYGRLTPAPWVWIATVFSIGCFAIPLVRSASRPMDPVTRFAWLWLATYAAFLSTWEPATLCYRLTDVIPLGLLLASAIRSLRVARRILIAAVLLAGTAVVNWETRIGPMRRTEENSLYQETMALSRTSPEQSLYVTGGGLPWIYLLYFTGRMAWNARAMSPDQLRDRLAPITKTRAVYIQMPLLRDPSVAESLKVFKLRRLEEGIPWYQLQ